MSGQCVLCGDITTTHMRRLRALPSFRHCAKCTARADAIIGFAMQSQGGEQQQQLELEDMPAEILLKIFASLRDDVQTLLRLAGTNRRLRQLVQDGTLWSEFNEITVPFNLRDLPPTELAVALLERARAASEQMEPGMSNYRTQLSILRHLLRNGHVNLARFVDATRDVIRTRWEHYEREFNRTLADTLSDIEYAIRTTARRLQLPTSDVQQHWLGAIRWIVEQFEMTTPPGIEAEPPIGFDEYRQIAGRSLFDGHVAMARILLEAMRVQLGRETSRPYFEDYLLNSMIDRETPAAAVTLILQYVSPQDFLPTSLGRDPVLNAVLACNVVALHVFLADPRADLTAVTQEHVDTARQRCKEEVVRVLEEFRERADDGVYSSSRHDDDDNNTAIFCRDD